MNKREVVLLAIGAKLLLVSVCMCLLAAHYIFERYIVTSILSSSLDIEKPVVYNTDGFTPLIDAANRGDVALAKKLIDEGQPINAVSKTRDLITGLPVKNTALHFAIFNSNFDQNFEIAKLLIDAEANVRMPNANGDTPVHFLIQVQNIEKRAELLARLMLRGADINARNNAGKTIVHLLVPAKEVQFYEVLKTTFGPFIDFDARDNSGMTAKQMTLSLGLTDQAKVFAEPQSTIDTTGDLEQRDKLMKATPLMRAVLAGDVQTANKLIKRLANVNAQTYDTFQNTILHLALLSQRVNMVKLLLDNGADVNRTNARGDTPLHYVVFIDEIGKPTPQEAMALRNEAAVYLIEKKANLNAQNLEGDTLLHKIAVHNAVELIKLLSEKYSTNLDITIRNKEGLTAIELAKRLKRDGVVTYLEALETAREFNRSPQK